MNNTLKNGCLFNDGNLSSEQAQEAISKSIGTGIRKFNLRDIEVLRDELGKPIVKTYNNFKQICIDYNVSEIKVSISHCKDYAIANSIAITKEG